MLIYKIATQINKLQAQGLTLKEVADRLGIDPRVVGRNGTLGYVIPKK